MTAKPEKVQYIKKEDGTGLTIQEFYRIQTGDYEPAVSVSEYIAKKLAPKYEQTPQDNYSIQSLMVEGHSAEFSDTIKANETVSFTILRNPFADELLPEPISLDVIYEDDHIIVLNKPSGMVVHPGHDHHRGTLVNALLHHFQEREGAIDKRMIPGIVHRLDKDTSGLTVVAKHKEAVRDLYYQFARKTIDRYYTALVLGNVKEDAGTINEPITAQEGSTKMKIATSSEGKQAMTHFRVIARLGMATLLNCWLETGRTHQIRLHMASHGFPVFNDLLYGSSISDFNQGVGFSDRLKAKLNHVCPRQALHAGSLGLVHPKGWQQLFFEKAMPKDMQKVVEICQNMKLNSNNQ